MTGTVHRRVEIISTDQRLGRSVWTPVRDDVTSNVLDHETGELALES